MKIESWLFSGGVIFFLPVCVVYGYLTNWNEWVGIVGLLLLAGLSLMVGWYLATTAKRVGARPEDRLDAEIHEGAGEQGHFSPWSWWPITLSAAAAIGFLGLAVGWWILYIGAGLAVVSIVGWVYEYSRGLHAH